MPKTHQNLKAHTCCSLKFKRRTSKEFLILQTYTFKAIFRLQMQQKINMLMRNDFFKRKGMVLNPLCHIFSCRHSNSSVGMCDLSTQTSYGNHKNYSFCLLQFFFWWLEPSFTVYKSKSRDNRLCN